MNRHSVFPMAGLIAALSILACSGTAQNASEDRVASSPSPGPAGATAHPWLAVPPPVPDSARVPIVPILGRYEVLAVYDILPINSGRADYSGVTVIEADSAGATLWLADDKPSPMERAVSRVRLDLPRASRPGVTALSPVPVRISNAHGIPTGDDIEDLAWLPASGKAPALVAAVGERGPKDAPMSWFYLLVPDGDGLRLSRSGSASPPGESVGNDGMEGLALRRLATGRAELYLFKERPAPVYARLYTLVPDSVGYGLAGDSPDTLLPMDGFQTQAGATFGTSGDRVYVIDRQRRQIGMQFPRENGRGLEKRPREWLDFTGVDSLLEGRGAQAPASLFGVAEGIAEDSLGRLYLLADNNEVRHSRLVVLRMVGTRER